MLFQGPCRSFLRNLSIRTYFFDLKNVSKRWFWDRDICVGFFGFDAVWFPILVVKYGCSVLHSGRRFLSIRSPFLDFFISLERSFCALSSDISCYSRFYSRNILFSLLHFSILVDILIISGPRIDFVASDASFWALPSIVSVLCFFWTFFIFIISIFMQTHLDKVPLLHFGILFIIAIHCTCTIL